jgi:hypothetical protein
MLMGARYRTGGPPTTRSAKGEPGGGQVRIGPAAPKSPGASGKAAMARFHIIEGFVIVAGWGLLFLFGIGLFITRRDANRVYWALLTVLQVLLVVQLLAGLILLAAGGREALLHYLYGAVFPALVIGVCHVLTRGLEKPPYHLFFTIGSFFVFGLTARALMTGLGIG